MFRRSLTNMAKLQPEYLFNSLKKRGTTSFFGVPDSLLKSFCAYVADHTHPGQHVIAANEGSAMALATGHHLATGGIPCVYLQNSGIGNTVNPILSLMHEDVYRIPCLMVVGWRGQPLVKDEPQHVAQGKLTEHCLTSMDVPYSILGQSDDTQMNLDVILDKAYYHLEHHGTPFAIVVEKDALASYKMKGQDDDSGSVAANLAMSREQALEQVLRQLDDRDIVVSTTGMPSREVFEVRARMGQGHHRDFLTVGGMGHCSAIATGVALAKPERQVLCIDGDGAAIMHMGALAVNGGLSATKTVESGHGPLRNLKHVVINNGAHDSVGGQPTAAFDVSLTGVAKACGYCVVREEPVMELGDLVAAISDLKACDGPAFLEVLVTRGNRADLGRPTSSPQENKKAFMDFINSV